MKLSFLKDKYDELQKKLRFKFLLLVAFIEFGRFYSVDIVSPLQREIMEVNVYLPIGLFY